ncbi:hypothetical protein BRAO375_4370001 [Bradyrhizobium sp. ORS 375]|nr:hypothetical protein BRAO375_4370001 [Bradyrhizobium sp. ORS 375]
MGVGRRRRRHDRDPAAVSSRPPRRQDGRCNSAELRTGYGDRELPLQHVPRRRAGVGWHRRRAQGRTARQCRQHPAQRPPDRAQRRVVERDAPRQYHRDHRRRARRAGGLGGWAVEVTAGAVQQLLLRLPGTSYELGVVPASEPGPIPRRKRFEARWSLAFCPSRRPQRMGPGSAPQRADARRGLPGTTTESLVRRVDKGAPVLLRECAAASRAVPTKPADDADGR